MVSCSCFAPTPSMAAMLVNKFKMRNDVLTYNLSGMGCSSSLVCVDMASHLLKALPNTLALIVNHENITENWYTGNDRSMLVCNCLFRLGGAAALVSNRFVPQQQVTSLFDWFFYLPPLLIGAFTFLRLGLSSVASSDQDNAISGEMRSSRLPSRPAF